LTPHSEAVRERMDSECSGSFERRYDCKESIAIGTVRHSLINMVMRIGIVVSVPILMTVVFQNLVKPAARAAPRSFSAAAAQRRAAWSRPTAAARPSEPEPEEEEEEPPEDDMSWKKSAQRHVTQVVRPPDDPSAT
jgi:hypothetical protein